MDKQDENFPAQWALDLLRGPTLYKETWASKYLIDISFTIAGLFGWPIRNYFKSMPMYSGLPGYVVCTGIGFTLGHVFRRISDHRAAKRDAMMVDYIKHYPHRFPEPRNKKIAEILEPWVPLR